jgi:DNA-directed RNA polymerase beta subunit
MASLPSDEDLNKTVLSFVESRSLVSHQIESFDHFMEVNVPHIIYENSDIVMESDKTNIRHEIRFRNVVIQKPRIKEANGETRIIYPHECRARSLTYQCSVFVDVEHLVSKLDDEHKNPQLIQNNYYRELKIGKIPTMLQSNFCHLTDTDSLARECPFDGGGYFMINGVEKVIISQEKMRINHPYILAQKAKSKYAYVCEVRSCHETKLRSTSTLYVYITGGKGFNNPEIFVKVPFVDFHIPLIMVFKILGFRTTNEIFTAIIDSCDHNDTQLLNLVKSLIGNDIFDMDDTELYDLIGRMGTKELVKEKRIKSIEHIFGNEFLPHIGLERTKECYEEKAYYLGFLVKRLCLVHLGRPGYKPDDRDHYSFKRIDTTGRLMANQFRHLWRNLLKNISMSVKKCADSGSYVNVIDIIKKKKKKITSGFKYAVSTGKWGPQKGGSPQTGVAQIHTRMTLASGLSNLRRINTHIHKEGKLPKSRQLHLSHWGKVCVHPDTKVLLADGITSVPFRMLKGDELILTVNPKTLEYEASHYTDLFTINSKDYGKQMLKITTVSGKSIECTEDHPFLVQTGEWIEAGQLVPEIHKTMTVDENLLVVPETIYSIKHISHSDVMDFTTVSDNHSFVANGFVTHNCATQTPEGKSCGHHKYLTLFAHVRVGYPPHFIIEHIRRMDQFVPLLECTPGLKTHTTPLMVNGVLTGYCFEPKRFAQLLRQDRRDQILPFDVSIVFRKKKNLLVVSCDAGCLLRPVYILEKMHLHRQIMDQYGDHPSMLFDELLVQGVIEYVDADEETDLNIATTVGGVSPGHTHLEFYPTTILGVPANLIPHSHMNQAPRVSVFADLFCFT